MTTDKDQKDIKKAKKQIKEQVEETKKLDLGLDADGSSMHHHEPKSRFDGFLNDENLPRLDEK